MDALTLFANRPLPHRTGTVDGLEYLLAARLARLMTEESVIVWPDPQLRASTGW